MSLLSQDPRKIAGMSQTLLREARRAKRAGYGQLANQLAEAGTERKIQEKLAGGAQKLEQREAAVGDLMAREASNLNRQQLAGRQAFAKELRDMAKSGPAGTNVLGYAQSQGAKYGLSASQISSFFDREKLRRTVPGAVTPPTTATGTNPTPSTGSMFNNLPMYTGPYPLNPATLPAPAGGVGQTIPLSTPAAPAAGAGSTVQGAGRAQGATGVQGATGLNTADERLKNSLNRLTNRFGRTGGMS